MGGIIKYLVEEEVVGATSMYDIQNDIWFEGPSLITPRYAHSCCILNNMLYAIGGWYEDKDAHVSSIEVFNCIHWNSFAQD